MKILFLIVFFATSTINAQKGHALCYTIESWRRLGDAITTVCKTLYFAQTYNLPIYFQDFPYFDQFAISKEEKKLTQQIHNKFSKKILVSKAADIENNLNDKEPILFECHFLSETPLLYTLTQEYPEFGNSVRNLFRPLIEIPPLPKPPAVITVGLHVRKGGGFDRPLGSKQEYEAQQSLPKGIYLKKHYPQGSHDDLWHINWPPGLMYIEAIKQYLYKKNAFSDYIWPVKFPCDQYYIDQLKELSKMLPGKNLLVYLFTDDPDPEEIINRYSAQLKEYPRIIFSYRLKGNHHDKNVVQDLFSLSQCDCLISANSSFASAAQLLGNYQVMIFPVWATVFHDKIVINKVGIITIEQNKTTHYNNIHYREKSEIASC